MSAPKPPLSPIGLRPRRIVELERTQEIEAAMKRYLEGKKPIPTEWIEEYNELTARLNKSGHL